MNETWTTIITILGAVLVASMPGLIAGIVSSAQYKKKWRLEQEQILQAGKVANGDASTKLATAYTTLTEDLREELQRLDQKIEDQNKKLEEQSKLISTQNELISTQNELIEELTKGVEILCKQVEALGESPKYLPRKNDKTDR